MDLDGGPDGGPDVGGEDFGVELRSAILSFNDIVGGVPSVVVASSDIFQISIYALHHYTLRHKIYIYAKTLLQHNIFIESFDF